MTTPADLLQRARANGTPVIDGDQAVFVWEGESAPMLIGDFNGWGWTGGSVHLAETAPSLWTHTLTFPRDAYVEYIYTTDHTDPKARVIDPLSKRRSPNGVGQFNHTFTMPEAKISTLWRGRRGVRQGVVTHHPIENPLMGGRKRDVWLYAPPTDEPAALIVVYDGRDYLRRAHLPQIVDSLLAQGKIRPVALALIDNARHARTVEYNAGETALMFVSRLALPLAQGHLRLIDIEQQPGAYGVLGASMGGLMALHTGLRLPSIFGHVISQSGAFQFMPLDTVEPLPHTLIKALAPQISDRLRIWQDVGTMEWLLDSNRATHTLLKDQGYDVIYREFHTGHNYPAWRNILPEALTALYGVGG